MSIKKPRRFLLIAIIAVSLWPLGFAQARTFESGATWLRLVATRGTVTPSLTRNQTFGNPEEISSLGLSAEYVVRPTLTSITGVFFGSSKMSPHLVHFGARIRPARTGTALGPWLDGSFALATVPVAEPTSAAATGIGIRVSVGGDFMGTRHTSVAVAAIMDLLVIPGRSYAPYASAQLAISAGFGGILTPP